MGSPTHPDFRPESEAASLVQLLRSHLRADRTGFDDSLNLPSDPNDLETWEWDEVRCRRAAAAIVTALQAYTLNPSTAPENDLKEALHVAPARRIGRFLGELLDGESIQDRPVAHKIVRRIVESTRYSDVLNLGLVLLSKVGDATDNDLLDLVGMQQKFTRCAAQAIVGVNQDPLLALLELAPRTQYAGRVDMAECLLDHLTPVVRDFLLRRALIDVPLELAMDVSPRIAEECDLLGAISDDSADAELVRGIGSILLSLAEPRDYLRRRYADGARATIAYLRKAASITLSLQDLFTIVRLTSVVEGDDEQAWPAAEREQVRTLSQLVLDEPLARALVAEALDNPTRLWATVQIARRMHIPYRDRLVDRLRANPFDREAWLGYCHQVSDAELGEAICLAIEVLDLAGIGSGPADLEPSVPTPPGDLCLGLILHETSRGGDRDLPADSARLVRTALRSPVTSTRLRGVAAVGSWSLRWRRNLHRSIEAATRDPNAMVRREAEALLLRTDEALAAEGLGIASAWRLPAWIVEEREKRKETKARFGAFFGEIVALFQRIDPMGISFAREDEYVSEVGTILPRLDGANSLEDVRHVLEEEFTRWFAQAMVQRHPTRDRLDSLASELWTVWLARQRRDV